MADIFDEVSEELKRDNMTQFWDSYKYVIYGIAGLIIVGVGANSGYNEYMAGEQKENSALFDKGVTQLTGNNPALLKQLTVEGDAGYATLASLKLAQSYISTEKYKDAAAVLKTLSRTGEDPYKQLAKILYALYSDESPAKLLADIKPETEAGKPWRHQALTVATELALRANKTDDAKAFLVMLSNNTSTPTATRNLAKQILITLK